MNRRREDRLATWAKIISDVRFILPLIITLAGGTAYNFEAVKSVVHGPQDPIAAELHGAIDEALIEAENRPAIHPEVRRKIELLIKRVNEQSEQIKELRSRSDNFDSGLGRRIENIERLVN